MQFVEQIRRAVVIGFLSVLKEDKPVEEAFATFAPGAFRIVTSHLTCSVLELALVYRVHHAAAFIIDKLASSRLLNLTYECEVDRSVNAMALACMRVDGPSFAQYIVRQGKSVLLRDVPIHEHIVDDPRFIAMLLKAAPDADVTVASGVSRATCLHWAIVGGLRTVVRFLVGLPVTVGPETLVLSECVPNPGTVVTALLDNKTGPEAKLYHGQGHFRVLDVADMTPIALLGTLVKHGVLEDSVATDLKVILKEALQMWRGSPEARAAHGSALVAVTMSIPLQAVSDFTAFGRFCNECKGDTSPRELAKFELQFMETNPRGETVLWRSLALGGLTRPVILLTDLAAGNNMGAVMALRFRTYAGDSLLHAAAFAWSCPTNPYKTQNPVKFLRRLVEAGVDPKWTRHSGSTVLDVLMDHVKTLHLTCESLTVPPLPLLGCIQFLVEEVGMAVLPSHVSKAEGFAGLTTYLASRVNGVHPPQSYIRWMCTVGEVPAVARDPASDDHEPNYDQGYDVDSLRPVSADAKLKSVDNLSALPFACARVRDDLVTLLAQWKFPGMSSAGQIILHACGTEVSVLGLTVAPPGTFDIVEDACPRKKFLTFDDEDLAMSRIVSTVSQFMSSKQLNLQMGPGRMTALHYLAQRAARKSLYALFAQRGPDVNTTLKTSDGKTALELALAAAQHEFNAGNMDGVKQHHLFIAEYLVYTDGLKRIQATRVLNAVRSWATAEMASVRLDIDGHPSDALDMFRAWYDLRRKIGVGAPAIPIVPSKYSPASVAQFSRQVLDVHKAELMVFGDVLVTELDYASALATAQLFARIASGAGVPPFDFSESLVQGGGDRDPLIQFLNAVIDDVHEKPSRTVSVTPLAANPLDYLRAASAQIARACLNHARDLVAAQAKTQDASRLQAAEQTCVDLKTNNKALTKQLMTTTSERDALQVKLREAKDQTTAANNGMARIQKQHHDARQQVADLLQQVNKLTKDRDQAQAREHKEKDRFRQKLKELEDRERAEIDRLCQKLKEYEDRERERERERQSAVSVPAPTTLAPTPTTLAPTPTTLAPTLTTLAPTPTTLAPTTLAPTTLAPTPTTVAPTLTTLVEYECVLQLPTIKTGVVFGYPSCDVLKDVIKLYGVSLDVSDDKTTGVTTCVIKGRRAGLAYGALRARAHQLCNGLVGFRPPAISFVPSAAAIFLVADSVLVEPGSSRRALTVRSFDSHFRDWLLKERIVEYAMPKRVCGAIPGPVLAQWLNQDWIVTTAARPRVGLCDAFKFVVEGVVTTGPPCHVLLGLDFSEGDGSVVVRESYLQAIDKLLQRGFAVTVITWQRSLLSGAGADVDMRLTFAGSRFQLVYMEDVVKVVNPSGASGAGLVEVQDRVLRAVASASMSGVDSVPKSEYVSAETISVQYVQQNLELVQLNFPTEKIMFTSFRELLDRTPGLESCVDAMGRPKYRISQKTN